MCKDHCGISVTYTLTHKKVHRHTGAQARSLACSSAPLPRRKLWPPQICPPLSGHDDVSINCYASVFSPLLDTFFGSFLPTYTSDANLLGKNTPLHPGASARRVTFGVRNSPPHTLRPWYVGFWQCRRELIAQCCKVCLVKTTEQRRSEAGSHFSTWFKEWCCLKWFSYSRSAEMWWSKVWSKRRP